MNQSKIYFTMAFSFMLIVVTSTLQYLDRERVYTLRDQVSSLNIKVQALQSRVDALSDKPNKP